jgi:hypothetical protein
LRQPASGAKQAPGTTVPHRGGASLPVLPLHPRSRRIPSSPWPFVILNLGCGIFLPASKNGCPTSQIACRQATQNRRCLYLLRGKQPATPGVSTSLPASNVVTAPVTSCLPASKSRPGEVRISLPASKQRRTGVRICLPARNGRGSGLKVACPQASRACSAGSRQRRTHHCRVQRRMRWFRKFERPRSLAADRYTSPRTNSGHRASCDKDRGYDRRRKAMAQTYSTATFMTASGSRYAPSATGRSASCCHDRPGAGEERGMATATWRLRARCASYARRGVVAGDPRADRGALGG